MTSLSKSVKLTQFQREFIVDAAETYIRELRTLKIYAKGSAVAPYKGSMISSLKTLIKKVKE